MLIVAQLLKNFPACVYGNRKFTTVYTSFRHLLTLSQPIFFFPFSITICALFFPIFPFLHISLLVVCMNTSYMSHPSRSFVDHFSSIWRGVQFMKLLIMQFYPALCHLIPLKSKYSCQNPVPKSPLLALLLIWGPNFTPVQCLLFR
jgi:hypothetical protein